ALAYSRPNVFIAAAYGRQDGSADAEDLRLIDLSLDTWGRLLNRPLGGGTAGQTHFFVPVLLFSNYRSVAPTSDDEVITEGFNVTTLGLGAGVGLAHTGRRVQAEARAHPGLGLATSSLTDALGHARLAGADVQLHLARLFGRAGLTLGYAVRVQVWNVNASNLFPELTDDLFDYRGTQHLLRAGINF
ncbi:MAG: hypothetical protein R3247_17290, partial [Rhodothermales bacterium]|nr:hypothetical protein [Rhodothermales bacterium]